MDIIKIKLFYRIGTYLDAVKVPRVKQLYAQITNRIKGT